MPLLLKRASQEMRTSARLQANTLNSNIRGESQQLCTRATLANDDSSGRIQPHQMEQGFAQIDTDDVNFHSLPFLFHRPLGPVLHRNWFPAEPPPVAIH